MGNKRLRDARRKANGGRAKTKRKCVGEREGGGEKNINEAMETKWKSTDALCKGDGNQTGKEETQRALATSRVICLTPEAEVAQYY